MGRIRKVSSVRGVLSLSKGNGVRIDPWGYQQGLAPDAGADEVLVPRNQSESDADAATGLCHEHV